MKGRLTSDNTPYVTLILSGSLEQECVVDTGFSGGLYLSEGRIADLRLPFLTSAPMVLANHSVLIADVFEVTVMWFSTARRVTVIAGPVGYDALVGMELLKGSRIELDEIGGEVTIDPL